MPVLTKSDPPYRLPSYSLTGDLLSYQLCGLQYRYQNRGGLPSATPVQRWFGEFIHAVMEEGYVRWKASKAHRRFPWRWETRIRDIELTVHRRLAARNLVPPQQLFCPAQPDGSGCKEAQGCTHKLLASRRAESMFNEWGAHLYPLISEAEVRLRQVRPLAGIANGQYEISGVVDVLGSVELAKAPNDNLLLEAVNAHEDVARNIASATSAYEIIVDYKGMRRPPPSAPERQRFAWQILTYAWLRKLQPDAAPVVAGVLIFTNELQPSATDLRALRSELDAGQLDFAPDGEDLRRLKAWNGRAPVPELSLEFRRRRSIWPIAVDEAAIGGSLDRFDEAVSDIERSLIDEAAGSGVLAAWRTRSSGESFTAPERATCTACDFKTYCPKAAASRYGRPPAAP